jgi:hypothetical protein
LKLFQIKYNGIELDVHAIIDADGLAEVTSVFVGDIDIYDLLSIKVLHELIERVENEA